MQGLHGDRTGQAVWCQKTKAMELTCYIQSVEKASGLSCVIISIAYCLAYGDYYSLRTVIIESAILLDFASQVISYIMSWHWSLVSLL